MGMNITVLVGDTVETSVVQVSGDTWYQTTDAELATFGLTDDFVRAAFKAEGSTATDVYRHEPSPGGLFVNDRMWGQYFGHGVPVSTHLIAASGKVVGLSSKPEIVAHKRFHNGSSLPVTESGGISVAVTESVTSSWSESNTITAGIEIGYKLGPVEGKVKFEFSHNWTWGGSETKSTTLGSNDNVSVLLGPGQGIDAQLTANLGQITVEITYVASLAGDVIVYSTDLRRYAMLQVANLLQGRNSHVVKQTLVAGLYSSDYVNTVDEKTQGRIVNLPRALNMAAAVGGDSAD